MTPTMTSAQQRAALRAIISEQNTMLGLLGPNPSPEWIHFVNKNLEDLEGAYTAISAIETVD